MAYAFLAVSLVGALGVVNAYRPIRREPFTVPSFFIGWLVGELAIQNIVWQVAATVVFGVFGAFSAWPGDLGLLVAGASWAGLVGLAVVGQRAGRVVSVALGEATGAPLPAVPVPPKPAWGRWWRSTRALPLWSRSADLVKQIDYWGDGDRRHRLDVVRPRRDGRGAPVMIYIHGGAWIIGDKREQGKPMMYELVANGAGSASPSTTG